MYRILVFIFVFTTVICSCESQVDREIETFVGSEIKVFEKNMIKRFCSIHSDTSGIQKDFLLIRYFDIDSIGCSQCELSLLESTERLLREDNYDNVSTAYIVRCSTEKLDYAYRQMCNARLQGVVYFDTLNTFLYHNPTFPKNPMLHTFLLNDEHKVVMVGNPYQTSRLSELFKDIIHNHNKNQ